jgi:hypothetical protein
MKVSREPCFLPWVFLSGYGKLRFCWRSRWKLTQKIRTHGKVGIWHELAGWLTAKIECHRVCKQSSFPCAFVSADGKKKPYSASKYFHTFFIKFHTKKYFISQLYILKRSTTFSKELFSSKIQFKYVFAIFRLNMEMTFVKQPITMFILYTIHFLNHEIYQYFMISYTEVMVKIWVDFAHFFTYNAYKSKCLQRSVIELRRERLGL